MDRCRWVTDKDVPKGRFLVPGCWNRALNGDDADCHCAKGTETRAERIEAKMDRILERLDKLERK